MSLVSGKKDVSLVNMSLVSVSLFVSGKFVSSLYVSLHFMEGSPERDAATSY